MNTLIFQPNRILALVRRDAATGTRTILLRIASVGGVLFVLFFLSAALGSSSVVVDGAVASATASSLHRYVFPLLLVLGGFMTSSMAFSELQDSQKAVQYLTLPGSTFEKYVSRVVLVTIGWSLLVLIAYTLIAALAVAVSVPLFGRSCGLFLPTTSWVWNAVGTYIVGDATFVFGAIYFRKHPFLKTLLAAVIVVLAYLLFSFIAFRIVFIGPFTTIIPSASEIDRVGQPINNLPKSFTDFVTALGKVFTYGVLPLFLYVFGYRRLRETEV